MTSSHSIESFVTPHRCSSKVTYVTSLTEETSASSLISALGFVNESIYYNTLYDDGVSARHKHITSNVMVICQVTHRTHIFASNYMGV